MKSNEISVSVDTSESDFPSWNQNLVFKDNQFAEKEDVVVSSPDSDVFSHLAKFVIEAKDNINKLDTQIGNKLNLSSTTNLNVNQDGQLIANISNALKQYNQALSIAKAEVVDNVCLDLEIESKEEIKRLNLLFVTATIRKELDKLDEETIELVNLTMRELKGVNGVNTETIWTKKIYKTPDVNQSTNSSLNQGNKHEFLKVNTTKDTNTLKTTGAIIIAGIVLFGLFQLYKKVEYQTKYDKLSVNKQATCKVLEEQSAKVDEARAKFNKTIDKDDLINLKVAQMGYEYVSTKCTDSITKLIELKGSSGFMGISTANSNQNPLGATVTALPCRQ